MVKPASGSSVSAPHNNSISYVVKYPARKALKRGRKPNTRLIRGCIPSSIPTPPKLLLLTNTHPFTSDAEYYEKWNKDRQESIARGEDPNAKFLALVAAREEHSRVGKLRKLFGKRKEGKKAHGEGLTEEEEREALERDRNFAKERGGEKDDGVVR